MLWLGLGLGKSIITLSAFVELQDRLATGPMLVIGPLRVVQAVWQQEARKWEHTEHLRFQLIHGKPEDRLRAMMVPADVYLINYEGVAWMAQQIEDRYLRRGKYPPFSMVVYDEVTRVKNSEARVSEALWRILPYIERRVGLTGTPASNGYADLFGQYLAVDQGARLGQDLTSYRAAFLRFEGFGHMGKYKVRARMREAIHQRIADITLEMSTRDYLELPEVLTNDILLDLPPKLRGQYDMLEKEMFAELDSGVVITAVNMAAKSTKCRQFAAGASYVIPDDPQWENIHDIKMDMLDEVIEEAGGKPVLVATQYKHDVEKILKRWPEARTINSKVKEVELNALIADWNDNRIPLICGHPKSMGHGLNLQFGECQDVVYLGNDWSPEMMAQVLGRVMRQGQRNNIRAHRIMMRDTVDQLMAMVLAEKEQTEDGLKVAVNKYREMRGL